MLIGRCKYCGCNFGSRSTRHKVEYCSEECSDKFHIWVHQKYKVTPPYLIQIYYQMSAKDRCRIDRLLEKLMEENNRYSETTLKAVKTA